MTSAPDAICGCSFSGPSCSTYRLRACDIYAERASALAISQAPHHFSCACLQAVRDSGCVFGEQVLRQALESCHHQVNTSCERVHCGGRGLCVARHPPIRYTKPRERCSVLSLDATAFHRECTCSCLPPWVGRHCDARGRVACLRDCSGHGRCLTHFGVCACDAGYMGIDCHRAHGHGPQRSESVKHGRWRGGGSSSSSSSSSSSDSEVRPRIYVYDRPPPEDYSSLIGEDFVHEQGSRGRRRVNESGVGARWVTANDPIYAAGDAFFMRLLRDEEHRTLNPLHADLYFLPLERVIVQNTHDLVASELIDHWIDKWLEAHAQGPLDRHVWVISTDTCAASGSEAALEHLTSWLARHGGIIMCHYGLPHRLMPLMSGERARGSFVLTPGAPKSTLYGSDVDVWTQDRLVKQMHRAWHEVPGLHRKRRPQLLFWGSVRWHQCLGSAACQGCLRIRRLGRPVATDSILVASARSCGAAGRTIALQTFALKFRHAQKALPPRRMTSTMTRC